MKRTGYKLRDGFWIKECEFMNGSRVQARETLIRNLDWQLIAVVKGDYENSPLASVRTDISVAGVGGRSH